MLSVKHLSTHSKVVGDKNVQQFSLAYNFPYLSGFASLTNTLSKSNFFFRSQYVDGGAGGAVTSVDTHL